MKHPQYKLLALLTLGIASSLVALPRISESQTGPLVRLLRQPQLVAQEGNISITGEVKAGSFKATASGTSSIVDVRVPNRSGTVVDQRIFLGEFGSPRPTPPSPVSFTSGLTGTLSGLTFRTWADCSSINRVIRIYRGAGTGGELVFTGEPNIEQVPNSLEGKISISFSIPVLKGEVFTCEFVANDGCQPDFYSPMFWWFETFVLDAVDFPALFVANQGSIGVGTDDPRVAVDVRGIVRAERKEFRIAHPLDNDRELVHASVESDEMKNIYDGIVSLTSDGSAWVTMPRWFTSLNTDFRYQLTCLGGYAPVFVSKELHGNRFKISGGKSGLRVSWQVTGVRQDAWARANPLEVEPVSQER